MVLRENIIVFKGFLRSLAMLLLKTSSRTGKDSFVQSGQKAKFTAG